MPTAALRVNPSDTAQANRTIQLLCQKRQNCIFVDTSKFLADANGAIIPQFFQVDGLHLSPEGYKEWIAVLKQAMQQFPQR